VNRLIGLLLLAACLDAQTTQIRPDQLAIKSAPADLALSGIKLMAYSPANGAFYGVVLNGFSMSLSDGVLYVTAPASQAVEYPVLDVAATRQPDGSWLLALSPGAKVMQLYRNGQRLYGGSDYTVDAENPAKITPVGIWLPDDRVTANFFRVN